MRLPEPCLCGDPLCWRCFPADNPDEDTPTVPDACASLLDALDAADTALARVHAAVQRLLTAVHTSPRPRRPQDGRRPTGRQGGTERQQGEPMQIPFHPWQIVQRGHQWSLEPPRWRAWLFTLAGFLGFVLLLTVLRVGYQWMDARWQAQSEPLFPQAQGWMNARTGLNASLDLPSGCRTSFRVRLRGRGYAIGCPDGRVYTYTFPNHPSHGRISPDP